MRERPELCLKLAYHLPTSLQLVEVEIKSVAPTEANVPLPPLEGECSETLDCLALLRPSPSHFYSRIAGMARIKYEIGPVSSRQLKRLSATRSS